MEGDGDGDGKGFGAEAATVTDGTGGRGHVLHHVLAVAFGFGVFEIGAEIVEDAVKAGASGFGAGWTVEEEVLVFGGEVFEGTFDVDLVFFGGELDETQEVGGARAWAHSSVEEGLGPVGNGLGGIEVVDAAKAVAVGAGAVIGVEGEAAGLEAGDVDAAVGAGHGGGVEGLFLLSCLRVLQADEDKAIRHLKGFEDGGFEAARVGLSVGAGFEDDAVDHGFDGVVFALFEAHAVGEFGHFAVDAGAEALLVEGFELFTELALAAADDGGVDRDAFAGGEGSDALNNLLGGLAGDGASAVRAVGLAYAGVEEAKIVVDLSDGADGGAGAAGGGLLFNRDCGGQAIDGIDVGAFHLIEELAGVGGQGFDVTALSFGVDGVEGERGLAGAGKAGDDREGVARDADRDVAEVVLPCATDRNVCDAHAGDLAMFGQVSRIRYFAGREKPGQVGAGRGEMYPMEQQGYTFGSL